RMARVVLPGYFYHITQRGNNRQYVLKDAEDKRRYLYWMEEYRRKYAVEVFAYCLMDNHVHFIARPSTEDAFGRLYNTAHMRYAQYYNRRHKGSGHVWQGRFFSCLLWDQHLAAAVRYVERNPVRAGLVPKAWMWPWSSAGEHLGRGKGIIRLSDIRKYIGVENWGSYLDEGEGELNDIRAATRAGRVWGPVNYVERIERRFGVDLQKPRMGRPRKAARKK
ncbi:MAG: transposase, partial [Candidatus Omnitrophota bacterium]|nr:transposase [Candidatus Omnitrophota bacterium]